MKTAKEMFEELGYEQVDNSDSLIRYRKGFDDDILFYRYSKMYFRKDFCGGFGITVDEHKAIHQQMKELGWLDAEQRRMLKELDPNEKDLISELDWYKHEYFAECDRAEKLEKALDKACKLVADYSGSCPLDNYDIDLDCEDRCESNTKDCWKVLCLKDE